VHKVLDAIANHAVVNEVTLLYSRAAAVFASNSESTEDFLAITHQVFSSKRKIINKVKKKKKKHFLYSDGLCMTRIRFAGS
jgi:hypothetical protein